MQTKIFKSEKWNISKNVSHVLCRLYNEKCILTCFGKLPTILCRIRKWYSYTVKQWICVRWQQNRKKKVDNFCMTFFTFITVTYSKNVKICARFQTIFRNVLFAHGKQS